MNRQGFFIFGFTLFITICLVTCKDEVFLPSVMTSTVQITDSWTATTGGTITNDGGATIQDKGVVWNVVSGPTIDLNMGYTSEGKGSGSFTSIIGVLTVNIRYYVRAYAINKAGIAYGNEISFIFTRPEPPPSSYVLPRISTKAATEIRAGSALSGGVVVFEGTPAYTSCGVCWSTHNEPTINDNISSGSLNSLNYSVSLKNLEGSTLYYIRAYATNKAGTSYGNVVSFTTLKKGFPVVLLTNITNIDLTSASCDGNVISDEGLEVSDRGMCWSKNPDPVIGLDTTLNGNGQGKYRSSLKGLSPGIKYYVRAYAINSAGTAYSDIYRFNTIDTGLTVKDGEGNLYNTVQIGDQTWLSSNLRAAKYTSGDTIIDQCAYNNNEAYVAAYGRLYSRSVATMKTGACPVGWHVPTSDEWRSMAKFLVDGGFTFDGSTPSFTNYIGQGNNKLAKSLVADSDWDYSDVQGSPGNYDYIEKINASGFRALSAGQRYIDGSFMYMGSFCYWWNSDVGESWYVQPGGFAYIKDRTMWQVSYDSPHLAEISGYNNSVSIRCVKDK